MREGHALLALAFCISYSNRTIYERHSLCAQGADVGSEWAFPTAVLRAILVATQWLLERYCGQQHGIRNNNQHGLTDT